MTCSARAPGWARPTLAEVFEGWNAGDLDSFLIEITAKVLRQVDQATGRPLVEVILDQAEQKGTGRWSVQSALELGVPVTGITEAVFARVLSSQNEQRTAAAKVLGGPSGRLEGPGTGGVRRRRPRRPVRLQGGRLRPGVRADRGRRRGLWLGRRAGRAGHHLAGRLHHPGPVPGPHPRGLCGRPGLGNLLFAGYFRDAVGHAQDAWRRVVATAVTLGVATPAFASSLAYYDGFRRERGPANLLQAQRDFFGAHTYRRIDRPGSFHTRWSEDGQEVEV